MFESPMEEFLDNKSIHDANRSEDTLFNGILERMERESSDCVTISDLAKK